MNLLRIIWLDPINLASLSFYIGMWHWPRIDLHYCNYLCFPKTLYLTIKRLPHHIKILQDISSNEISWIVAWQLRKHWLWSQSALRWVLAPLYSLGKLLKVPRQQYVASLYLWALLGRLNEIIHIRHVNSVTVQMLLLLSLFLHCIFPPICSILEDTKQVYSMAPAFKKILI